MQHLSQISAIIYTLLSVLFYWARLLLHTHYHWQWVSLLVLNRNWRLSFTFLIIWLCVCVYTCIHTYIYVYYLHSEIPHKNLTTTATSIPGSDGRNGALICAIKCPRLSTPQTDDTLCILDNVYWRWPSRCLHCVSVHNLSQMTANGNVLTESCQCV